MNSPPYYRLDDLDYELKLFDPLPYLPVHNYTHTEDYVEVSQYNITFNNAYYKTKAHKKFIEHPRNMQMILDFTRYPMGTQVTGTELSYMYFVSWAINDIVSDTVLGIHHMPFAASTGIYSKSHSLYTGVQFITNDKAILKYILLKSVDKSLKIEIDEPKHLIEMFRYFQEFSKVMYLPSNDPEYPNHVLYWYDFPLEV